MKQSILICVCVLYCHLSLAQQSTKTTTSTAPTTTTTSTSGGNTCLPVLVDAVNAIQTLTEKVDLVLGFIPNILNKTDNVLLRVDRALDDVDHVLNSTVPNILNSVQEITDGINDASHVINDKLSSRSLIEIVVPTVFTSLIIFFVTLGVKNRFFPGTAPAHAPLTQVTIAESNV